MKKQKEYDKELTVDILNDEYAVHIFLGNTEKVKKKLTGLYPNICNSDLFEKSRGHFLAKGMENPSIWVGLSPEDPHFFATLAHEAVHAIDHIFFMLQENNAPEIYAHCVGAVVAKVEEWVKK